MFYSLHFMYILHIKEKIFKKSYLISGLRWTETCLLPLPFSEILFQVLYLDSVEHLLCIYFLFC